jgi:hypothetical protein
MVCPAIFLTDSIPSMPATESIKYAKETIHTKYEVYMVVKTEG